MVRQRFQFYVAGKLHLKSFPHWSHWSISVSLLVGVCVLSDSSIYISISLAFFATTERPETTLRHPGPRFEDCSNCRKVYVDINAHAMKHIDDQNECFQVPVRMCQRMEPSWLWIWLQQRWCPWMSLGHLGAPVQACFYNASNPTSDFDGYKGFRIVPELLTKDLQGLEVKQLDCDILLSPKPLSLMGFWRSWHKLCG